MDITTLMLILSILVIFIILMILYSARYIFNQESPSVTGKSAAMKKEEIINGYKEEMEALLIEYKDDGMRCLSEKRRTLHRINRELATNIFFDQDEVKSVLTMLANY